MSRITRTWFGILDVIFDIIVLILIHILIGGFVFDILERVVVAVSYKSQNKQNIISFDN